MPFNDDDIYVIDLRSMAVVQEYGARSPKAQQARLCGLPVRPGCGVFRGMQARSMMERAQAGHRAEAPPA